MTARRTPVPLAPRVAERLTALVPGERVVVALSGGLDSTVLLHLLRFGGVADGLGVIAAHFDHRMRTESAKDARWVAGLARAWETPIELGAATEPLPSEAAARDARYAFLEGVRVREGARWILTAHHADDQAETVLFRVVRGAGLAGLRGIPARRGALLRPLLPFWREELEAYARLSRITPRVDPSNFDLGFARNALRHEILPRLEAAVAPGARASLVRLARLAAREERGWTTLLRGFLEEAIVEAGEDRIAVSRPALLGHSPAVLDRLLRALVRRFDCTLDEAGTRAAAEFTRSGASGRGHRLPGGLLLSREFDRLVFSRVGTVEPDDGLIVRAEGSGEEGFEVGGRRFVARWASGEPWPTKHGLEAFAMRRLLFPLRIRGWRPGDRIRLAYGSKKLKKLLGEARIPASERSRLPVLLDGAGQVLWLPGIARGAGTEPTAGEEVFHIGIRDEGRA